MEALSAANYSCLLSPSFTGCTDVQDFRTQFAAFSHLPIGSSDSRPPPAFLFCRLSGDSLTFHRSLTTAQEGSYNELRRLIRQQYKANADVLKAQIKSCRQLPGQNVSAFHRTLRDMAGKVYTDDAVSNELLLTTFIEGLANSVVRWERRKAKPTVVKNAVSLALEMQPYLNIHGQQPDTSAECPKKLTCPSTSDSELFCDLIFNFTEESKRVADERSGPRNDTAVVNVLAAAYRNNRSPTTTLIKVSAAIGTKVKKIAPIAEVTPQSRSITRFKQKSEFQKFWNLHREKMPTLPP